MFKSSKFKKILHLVGGVLLFLCNFLPNEILVLFMFLFFIGYTIFDYIKNHKKLDVHNPCHHQKINRIVNLIDSKIIDSQSDIPSDKSVK